MGFGVADGRWAFTSVAVGLDLGASLGPYHQSGFMDEHSPWAKYDTAGWFNAAARFQYLHQRGFSFRAFLGAATLLNPNDGNCGDGYEATQCERIVLGYGRLAFGYVRAGHRLARARRSEALYIVGQRVFRAATRRPSPAPKSRSDEDRCA